MKKKPTKVISFRTSEDFFAKVEREAKKKKLTRSQFVESLFTIAFEQETQKPQKQAA